MYIRGKNSTIMAAIAALGLWAGSSPLAAADIDTATAYQPLWIQGQGQAHIDMLRQERMSLTESVVSSPRPYLPTALLAVWAQGRGQAHIDLFRREYEGATQTRSVSNEPWRPKIFMAVWAQGRGQAHIDMLKREYESVNKDLVTDTDGRGDGGHI